MKNIRKVLIYLLFFIVTIFSFNNSVDAKDENVWDYYFAPGRFINAFAEAEYCSYTRYGVAKITASYIEDDVKIELGSLYNGDHMSADNNKYKYFAFIYYNGQIYFASYYYQVGGAENLKIINTGEKNGVNTTYEGAYEWNDETDQKIFFVPSLKDYLIVDGKLECKPLVFEERNEDLFVYRGDDYLYNDVIGSKQSNALSLEDLYNDAIGNNSDYYDPNANNFMDYNIAKALSVSFITNGTHHYAQKVELTCNEKLIELEKIDQGYEQILSYYDVLEKDINTLLTEGGYSDLKVDRIRNTVGYFETWFAEITDNLEKLEITDKNENGLFNIKKCENINNSYELFKKLSYGAQSFSEQKIQRIYNYMVTATERWGSDEAKRQAEEVGEILERIRIDWEKYINRITLGTEFINKTCEGLFGPDLLDDISTVLTWIRIAVPIIVIVLGSVDFAKAVISDDQQQMKKSTSTFIKRCIIAVAIFFVPTLIMYILSFIDMIADVSCDIRLW